MTILRFNISFVSAVTLLLVGCTTTEQHHSKVRWLSAKQAQAQTRDMQRKGMLPSNVYCLMEGRKGPHRPYGYWMRFDYKPNPTGKSWRYGVGEADEMQVFANNARRENLKLVTRKQMVDVNTGQKASCALWLG
jgi:hypothetical protein